MIRRLHDLLRHQERNSLQMRLAYLTAIGVALSAFCIGMATYFTARSSMYSQLDQELLEVASYASGPISTRCWPRSMPPMCRSQPIGPTSCGLSWMTCRRTFPVMASR